MAESINGEPLPAGWRRLDLEALIDLAEKHEVTYWLDDAVIRREYTRQIRQAILAATSKGGTVDAGGPRRKRTVGKEQEARLLEALRMREDGATWRVIAEALNWSSSRSAVAAVKHYCARTGRAYPESGHERKPLDPLLMDRALDLRRLGKLWREIASELGCSESGIYNAVRKHCEATGQEFPFGWTEQGREANRQRGLGVTLTSHCPRGHEYTPENTYRNSKNPSKGKQCRICRRAKKREQKRNRRREEAGLARVAA